uniref:Uncharacterized protein n=1 Tax=Esox lucius TaxID=8010 RepID=A0A3P9ALB0_ESOLU
MSAQGAHHHGKELLECVIWIHVQFLRVQHAQLGVGGLDVIHVLYRLVQSTQYSLSMSCNHGVSLDGSRVVKEALGKIIRMTEGTSYIRHVVATPNANDWFN